MHLFKPSFLRYNPSRERSCCRRDDFRGICLLSKMLHLSKGETLFGRHGVAYTLRDIQSNRPSEKELYAWWKASGLPLRKFFNTSGLAYRALSLKEKLPEMSEEQQLKLLASDGMLVKRPVLVKEGLVLVGFRQKEWEEALLP